MRLKKLILIACVFLLFFTQFAVPASADFDRDATKKSVFKIYIDYSVKIFDDFYTISAQGTGFAIGKKGEKIQYLLTNFHVMDEQEVLSDVANQVVDLLRRDGINATAQEVSKYVHIQEKHSYIMLYDAPIDIKLTKAMAANDLAVIEVANEKEKLNVEPLIFGDPAAVKTGDKVYAYGYPAIVDSLVSFYAGAPRAAARPGDVSFTNGEVNQKTQIPKEGSYPLDVIVNTAPISPGNSGGPLVNENGNVIGINTFGNTQFNNYSVAMVPNNLFGVLDTLGIKIERTTDQKPVEKKVEKSFFAELFAKKLVWVVSGVVVVLIVAVIIVLAVGLGRKKKDPIQVRVIPQNPPMVGMGAAQGLPGQNQAYLSPPAQANPTLAGVSGHFAGNNMGLTGTMIIGRDPAQCQLVYPPNTTDVSRRHCCISYNSSSQTFVLEDLNSSNGTYLANGQRVLPGQPHFLKSGEKFYLGVPSNMFEVRN